MSASPGSRRSRPRVLIACPGLDHVGRGFETFALECFQALRDSDRLDVVLAKGSGDRRPAEVVAPTLPRDAAVTRSLARVFQVRGYDLEQLGFALSILPRLERLRPDLLFLSDLRTSELLARWRRRRRAQFKLAISNGGPYSLESMRHADWVHQPTAPGRDAAVQACDSSERHAHLPIGISMPPALEPLAPADRDALRARLGLAVDRPLVLTVAALNTFHKRLDYVIREIASIPAPRPFLLILGADDPEAPAVRSLAADLLPGGHEIRSVPSHEVDAYYASADAFVLGSTYEAFGKVMVEAAAQGLPCAVHDGPVQRWLLGASGRLADLTHPGALASIVRELCELPRDPEAMRERHRAMYERFSWDVLAPQYAELMIAWAR